MAIRELLGAAAVANFFEAYYLKLPYARPGGCSHLRPVASCQVAQAIALQPGADLLAARGGRPWGGPPPASRDDLRQLIDAGFTLRIRRAEHQDTGLSRLAEAFQRDFGAPVNIHLYWTPAGEPGFGWHYDAEDVFLLQTEGSKEWWVRKNTVNPWPLAEALPADMRYPREIAPAMCCTLAAGDWLYIPAGYWHRSRAGEESISLSVGLLSPTALDVYDFLRGRLTESLRWRQRVPPAGEASPLSRAELLERYRELFADLGKDLADLLGREETAQAFLDHTAAAVRPEGEPPAPGPLL